MGYMHIDNLYKDTTIIELFKECYALEKIHGTSAHIGFKADYEPRDTPNPFRYFAGGFNHELFVKLFDEQAMLKVIAENGTPSFTVYGEYYGGKIQGMKDVYGPSVKFVAFDVKIDDHWLDVPRAAAFCNNLGIEFVWFDKISTDLTVVNSVRDMPSEQAKRNGMGDDKVGEGIVLRPLTELYKKNGARVIAKHKRLEFSEHMHARKVEVDPDKAKRVQTARDLAEDWVTEMRLDHVLQRIRSDRAVGVSVLCGPSTGVQDTNVKRLWDEVDKFDVSHTKEVIDAMLNDVIREGEGEIEVTPEVKKAICTRAAQLFKNRCKKLEV